MNWLTEGLDDIEQLCDDYTVTYNALNLIVSVLDDGEADKLGRVRQVVTKALTMVDREPGVK